MNHDYIEESDSTELADAAAKRTANLKAAEKQREADAQPKRALTPEQQAQEKRHRDALAHHGLNMDGHPSQHDLDQTTTK